MALTPAQQGPGAHGHVAAVAIVAIVGLVVILVVALFGTQGAALAPRQAGPQAVAIALPAPAPASAPAPRAAKPSDWQKDVASRLPACPTPIKPDSPNPCTQRP